MLRLDSPTSRLLAGLGVTLAAVAVFSWYVLRQIAGLRELQEQAVDRNRRDSLQLLRIQNDLHSLGLAMRDILEASEPYPLSAWKSQFDRLRADLEDALRLEARLAPAERGVERQQYLAASLAQFWRTAGQVFTRNETQARELIRNSLQPQQAALTAAVARLLVQNNEVEEQAAARIQAIYARVERNVYYFLGAVLLAIALTTLYLILANRALFQRLAALSEQRSDLARQLIAVQEETLRSISRELHDEFGQILTAIGAMVRRAEKKAPEEFQAALRELREVAQETLEKIRTLSQALHPAVLDDAGLEKAVEWYLPLFERQTGVKVRYQKEGTAAVPDRVAIHVYRVLQEALNNIARHSRSAEAWVRMRLSPGALDLEVEDRGVGLAEARGGIGLVAMRERAELLEGRLELLRPREGGTLVRLKVPL